MSELEPDNETAGRLAARAAKVLYDNENPRNRSMELGVLKDLAAALILVKASVDRDARTDPQTNGSALGGDSDDAPLTLSFENTHDLLRVFAFNNEFLIAVKKVDTHDSSLPVGGGCGDSQPTGREPAGDGER